MTIVDDRKCEVLEISNKPNEPHSEPVPVKNDDDNEKLNADEKHSLNEDQLSKIDKSEALSKMDAFQVSLITLIFIFNGGWAILGTLD